MSNRPSHESVVEALENMIHYAGFSMDCLSGDDAKIAEADIIKAKRVLAELENS